MVFRSKAPLRLGFAGGGTDVSPFSDQHGGFVLNATIDMYAYCTIFAIPGEGICFQAMDLQESFRGPLQEFFPLDGVLSLHKAVYNRVVKEFNQGKPMEICVVTYSDAPPGSGLGSSSTMVVAMLRAYQEALNIPLGEYDLAQLAFEIERCDVGLAGGKQDQYAATFGGVNFMEFYGHDRVIVNPLRIKDATINELVNSIVLYYTGRSRDSARIIQEQVDNTNARSEQSVQAMFEVKEDALSMKEFLLKGDIEGFTAHLGKSWQAKKRMAKAISNDFIESIFERASEAGAQAGKISGAGGGGFMMLMTSPTRRLELLSALKPLPGEIVRFHFTGQGAQSWRA